MSGLNCHELVNEWSVATTTRVAAVNIFVRELIHICLTVHDNPSEEIPLLSSPRKGCQTPIAKMLDAGDSMRRHCHISTEVFARYLRSCDVHASLGWLHDLHTVVATSMVADVLRFLLPDVVAFSCITFRTDYHQVLHTAGTQYLCNPYRANCRFYYAYVGPASSFLMLSGTTHAPP